ncbi:hypothetical protein [uncultured Draconibacterium sp.]|uniref:hypothetical protein n=1 Tax=uncultured Draconibacterium sp. TaxID=1573823 RepID=UPI0029C78438|nr:hypothetical protein [uncultured Draconibacterium sp.]
MRILCHYSLIIVCLLSFSVCNAQKQKSQTEEAAATAQSFVKAETVKAIEANLIKALEAERNSAAVTNAMTKFWESAKGLNHKQVEALANRFVSASKTNLQKLSTLSTSQLKNYAREVSGSLKVDAKTLKQIVYGAGDKAGNATLKTLQEIDDVLARTGNMSKDLLLKLRSEASGLDPNQARAFYDLVKDKVSSDWKDIKNLDKATDGIGKYVGTVVDGVFVLSDAYDIYYSDDEPEVKAINATGKIIDYGVSTGAGAASAALGGGLGPGLVIAFTANRVSTLYTEIAMLEKEKEAAANAELNEKINNSILARRQLVNISHLIQSGNLNKANFLLNKLRQFIVGHNFDNVEMLLKLHNELEQRAKEAERNEKINQIINSARYPYRDALNYYTKGVELNQAKKYAAEALNILKNEAKTYPEIKELKAIQITQQLLKAINARITNASALSITSVSAPVKVYIGQAIEISVSVHGGIPYYKTIGELSGNISDDIVTVYWEAPEKPGKKRVNIKVQDCLGNTTSKSKEIEVVIKEDLGNFPYGEWSTMNVPQNTVEGDVLNFDTKSETDSYFKKKIAETLSNPVFSSHPSKYIEDEVTLKLTPENYSFTKKNNLFIITPKQKSDKYRITYIFRLIDDKNFEGKFIGSQEFTTSKGTFYWFNYMDLKGTKIK